MIVMLLIPFEQLAHVHEPMIEFRRELVALVPGQFIRKLAHLLVEEGAVESEKEGVKLYSTLTR